MSVLKIDVLPGKLNVPMLKHRAHAQKLTGHGTGRNEHGTGRIWNFLTVIPLVFAGTVLKTQKASLWEKTTCPTSVFLTRNNKT